MNLRQKLKFVFALSLFSASMVLASSPLKSKLPTSTFTLDRGESISEALNAPITITNNTVVSSTFSVMLMDDVLDGGLTGATITDNHVGKTWIVQSSSATNTGSGIDIELEWDESEEVGSIPSYDVVYFDESTSEWKGLSGSTGSVQTSGTTKTVSISGVTTDFTDPVMLAVAPAPTIPLVLTDFSPKSGGVGTQVTITGSGFSSTASSNTVFVGNVPVTVSSASSTQLIVSIPVSANGPITVVNTSSNSVAKTALHFSSTLSASGFDINTCSFQLNSSISISGTGKVGTAWHDQRFIPIGTGDFNADGKLDFAKVNGSATAKGVDVYLNSSTGDGNFGFTLGTAISSTLTLTSLVVEDFNGDGKLDIAATDGSTISIYKNTSSGGTVSFDSPVNISTNISALRLVAGDVDGDGNIDLFYGTTYGYAIGIARNNSNAGSISFSNGVNYITGLGGTRGFGVGDVNDDGKADVYVGTDGTNGSNYGNTVQISTTTAGGTLSTPTALSVTSQMSAGMHGISSLVDVNNDGKIDLVKADGGNIKFSQNSFSSGSISSSNFATGVSVSNFGGNVYHPLDFNGDGLLDFVNFNNLGSGIKALTNKTSSSITSSGFAVNSIESTTPGYWEGIVGDFDQDGRSDIIGFVPVSTGSTLKVYESVAPPNITLTSSFSSFNACFGSPSAEQSFSVTGSDLSGDITVTAPSNWEISQTSGGTFTSSITLTQNSGVVGSTTIYIRSKNTASGSISGNLSASSSCATTVNSALSGVVNSAPNITTSTISDISFSDNSFSIPYSATTNSPDQYSVSSGTNVPGSFQNVLNAALSNTSGTLGIPFPAGTAQGTYDVNLIVTNSTTGCSSTISNLSFNVVGPSAPGVTSPINLCQGDVASPLTATESTGYSLRWYTVSTGGTGSSTAPTPSTSSAGSTSYYVSQVDPTYSVESSREEIVVNVNALPAAPVVSDLDVCNGDVVDLSTVSTALSGHTLSWSTGGNAATTTVPNYTSSTAGQTTYSVYQTDDVTGCVSSAVTQTITVAGFPNPGTSGTLDICYGGTVTSQEMLDVINTSSTLTNTRTNSTGGTAEGFFMEVEAVNNIVINSVNVRMTNSSPSVKVYYRNGSWSSFTNSSSGWTLLDEATNVTNVSSGLTPLNLNMGLAIPAGDKVSLYVVSTTRVINYEGGVSTGQVTGSDSNLKMYSGAGKFGVFSGSEYKPRNFYGSLEYTVGTEAFNANGTWSPTLGGAGTYTYTATNSAGCQATSQVVVTEYPQVTFTGGSSVGLGDEITLSASTNPASSGAWASSNTSILTVSSAGVVSGVGLGNANVIYTDVNGCQTTHAIQVIQGTTQAPTLTSPASNLTGATTFAVTYSLPETPLSGSVKLTFSPTDGGTPIVWTMGDATSVNFNYDVNTTPSNAAIVTGALIPYDTYDVELSYQDAYSNPAATVTNTNIQTLAPPAISYAPASYAYLTNSAISAITPSNTGGAITSYAIVGTLPAGLNFSTTTGQITGTPTALQTLTTYSVTATNASGSSTTTLEIVVDVDTDGDGIPDASDVDVDGDGVPDNGTDTDGDGINNDFDDDIDGDGIPNDQDNDIDGDGIPNDEDVDVNGDGTNDNGTDTDGDGVNDANDPDIDGDGIPNGSDSCPTIINTDITVQPSTQSEDICPSLTLTDLEVTAVGENLTYQWYSNSTSSTTGGTAVSGANSATFTPPALVGPTYYYVVVSGDCGVETSTISGALYVRDVVNPTVTALSSYTVQLDASGAYTVTEADIITAKSDNCTAVPVITLANNVFACSDLTASGLSVSWTATDDEGNTTTGTVPVTVVDQIAPTMAVQNVSVQMDASGNSSVSFNQVDNGTTDNCAATLSFDAAGAVTTMNYTATDLGTNSVTLYGTDASGNQSSQAAVVTVVDQISPVVNTQNVTVYLDANGAASITTADIDNGTTDNSGVFTLSLDVTSFDCDDLGTNTVVLTATDGSGNVSNANATVTVVDNITPVMNITNSYAQLGPDGTVTLTQSDISGVLTDNCDLTWTFSTATFDCTMLGANIITVTAADAAGNSATDEIVVTIVDNSAPIVATQAASLMLDANGVATLDTTDVIDYIIENCSVSTITVSQTSFNCSDLGANVVTLLVLDSEGNSTAKTATVTVTDAIAPTAVAQDITLALDASGAASINYLDVEDGSSDNCGVDSYSIDNGTFSCSDLGVNWVVLTVADASGNTDTAWAKVTVVDQVAPTVLVQPATVALDASGAATLAAADVDAGSYDNCSGVTLAVDVTSFTCADLGANTVTLTATDAAGNTTSVATTVTVVDNSAPVVATQAVSLTLDVNGAATLDTADVIDYILENCSVASITLSETNFTCADLGGNTVTLTVTDAAGNSTAKSATVTVTDALAPTAVAQDITLALDASGAASINYLDVEDGSSDNCGVDSYSIDNGTFSCSDLGVNWVVLTVADASGNTDTAWAKVTVVDQVAPTVLVQPATVALDGTGAATLAAADVDAGSYDNCSGVTLAVDVTSFTCADLGANTVTLTATDAAGNTTSVATTVTVVDNSAPVVATVGDTLYLDNMGAATLDTADVITSMSDNCGIGSVTLSEYNFGCSDLGSNTVDVTVTDATGNVSTSQVSVLVLDTITPSIIMPSMMTVYANATCSATATWSTQVLDNCSATWSSNYASGSTFNAGTHFVVTTAQDASGNSVVDTMILSVVDTISPIWTQQPFVVSMVPGGSCGAYVTWVTPMALDWCSTVSITSNYTNGSLFNSGTHTVIFTATDDNQNSSTISLTFTVNDGIAPVVNVPATVFAVNDPGLCGAMVTLPTPTATDNCGIDTVYYDIPSGSFFSVGVTQVTITAVDDDGNTAQGVFNVEVSDVEAPTFTTVPNDTILGSCQNAFAYAMPTASDNCGVASVSLISGIASGNSFPTGTNTNVFEVIDIHGNSDTVSFTVTVLPQTVAPIPQYGPICANSGAFDLTGGDAGFTFWGDNVDGNYFNPYGAGAGSATIYYSYTDSLGCTQNASTSIFVNQSPDNPIIQRLSSTFLTVHKAYAKYQWYYNGVAIAGATSQTYNATQGGNYKVRVWNTAGCTEISSPFFVGTIGIEDITIDDINIYPNPTSGQFTIDVKGLTEDVTVMVYDALGKHISTTIIEGGSAKAMDISNEAQGLYQVVIRDVNGASITKRISLQK